MKIKTWSSLLSSSSVTFVTHKRFSILFFPCSCCTFKEYRHLNPWGLFSHCFVKLNSSLELYYCDWWNCLVWNMVWNIIHSLFQSYNTVYGNEALYQDGAASDVHDFSSRAHLLGQEELDDVQKALRKEVSIFERRESLLGSFKV